MTFQFKCRLNMTYYDPIIEERGEIMNLVE